MDFTSKIRYESKIVPGAVVYFKRATAPGRAILFESLAGSRGKIRAIQRERKPLDEAYQKALDKAKAAAKVEVDKLIEAEKIDRAEAEKRVRLVIDFPDDQFAEWADLVDQQKRIEHDAEGIAGLRAQFVSIEGVTVDGKTPTLDELIAAAPVEFVDELIEAADKVARLGPTERGESLWPTTSPVPEGGPTPSMTAESAESKPEAD